MIGEIKAFAGSTIPRFHLECDGSAISRTTYSVLFSVIGTLFGVGDGSTTFNLPNMKGRLLVGYNSSDTDYDAVGKTGGVDTINIQHTHTQNTHTHSISGTTNNVSGNEGSGSGKTVASNTHNHPFGPFTSSTQSNTGMDNQLSTTQAIRSPFITMKFVIQYKERRSRAFPMFSLIH